jgi:hypothetical protein
LNEAADDGLAELQQLCWIGCSSTRAVVRGADAQSTEFDPRAILAALERNYVDECRSAA